MLTAAVDKVIFGLDGLFGSATLRGDCWSQVAIQRPEELKNCKLVACSVSRNGRQLCLETDSKLMHLFTLDNEVWNSRGFCHIPRRSSSLLFTPDQTAVIFGDKSGNVFKLPVNDFGQRSECKDSNPLLGHLSMLSDIVISDCGSLIATSDRDEKIRVSLFNQPSVIESFCLGHLAFVSQLAFIPNSECLLSAGGDCYLRFWNSRSGCELGAYKLEFPDVVGMSLEDGTPNADAPVIVSRLAVIKPNVCVGACASHPVIFALVVRTVADDAKAVWGPISVIVTPGNRPLIDCAVMSRSSSSNTQSHACVVGLTDESPSRLVSWTLSLSSTGSPNACQFGELHEIYVFPEEIQSHLPVPHPRLELLKSMFKVCTDRSMLDAYEEMKPIRHQHVLDRRIRHQKIRQRNKKLKQSISN